MKPGNELLAYGLLAGCFPKAVNDSLWKDQVRDSSSN